MHFIIFFDTEGQVTDVWRWSTEEQKDYERVLMNLQTTDNHKRIFQYGFF